MFFGVGQVASPLILIFCFSIFYLARISVKSFKVNAVFFFFFLLATYFLIGAYSRLFYSLEINYKVPWQRLISDMITSLIVIVAYLQYFYRRLYQDKDLYRVLMLITIPLGFSIAILILQPLFGIYSFNPDKLKSTRGMGVFANPNVAANCANMALIFLIDFFFRYKKYMLLKFGLILLGIVGCILPFSKMGILNMLITIVLAMFYFLYKFPKTGKGYILQAIIFIVFPLVVVNYVYINHDQILDDNLNHAQKTRVLALETLLIKRELNKKTTSERSDIVAHGVELIKQKPLFGYGIGYFNNIPGRIGIHNTFLLTFGNSGFLPFLVLMSLIIYLYIQSFFRRSTGFLVLGLTTLTVLSYTASHNGFDDKILVLAFLFPIVFTGYGKGLPYTK